MTKVEAVSIEKAKAAAVKFLPSGDYVLVVVGKAAEIGGLLQKFGTWGEKKITDPDF